MGIRQKTTSTQTKILGNQNLAQLLQIVSSHTRKKAPTIGPWKLPFLGIAHNGSHGRYMKI